MRTNQLGIDLIKRFEGLVLHSYKDAVGIWTIGWGHTKQVHAGMIVTLDEAGTLLNQDIEWAEHWVDTLVKVPLTDNQYSALVSFVFNLGPGHFSASTLLLALNHTQYDKAADEFLRWTHAGGTVLPGLVKRRAAERELFLKVNT